MSNQTIHGLQVSGHGSVQATNLAAGQHATAIFQAKPDPQRQEALEEILQRLDQLAEQIQREQSLADRESVAEAAATLKGEITREKPNRLTVSAILEGIGSAVKSVTGIAASVEGLKAIIGRLF
jgi:biotin-(acetyl-CoA carboxylase) ligase